VLLFCVCAALWRADPPSKESYWLCKRSRNWKSGRSPIKGCRAMDGWPDGRADSIFHCRVTQRHVSAVRLDEVSISIRIYWTLWYRAWLHFTFNYYTLCPQLRLDCRCLVAASNGGRFPSSGFPNGPRPQLPASYSKSSQQLNPRGFLTNKLTHSLTNSPSN
jgi:hypothetical protein